MVRLKFDFKEKPWNLVGQKIWLEYFDQNYKFGEAFTAQYCTVVARRSDTSGADDWFLAALEVPFEYDGTKYDHLLIRSRWVGCPIGVSEATAVFIVLVPRPNKLQEPFEFDRSLYIAWGLAAKTKSDIKR